MLGSAELVQCGVGRGESFSVLHADNESVGEVGHGLVVCWPAREAGECGAVTAGSAAGIAQDVGDDSVPSGP